MSIPVSNYKNIAFSSQFRYMNVHKKGSTTATIASTPFATATATIAHNLGYNPFFRVYITPPGDTKIYSDGAGFFTFLVMLPYQVDNIHADSTNLYVTMSTEASGVGGTFTVYYRIYKEPR